MEPSELKKLRNGMDARQKDLAKILCVPVRTYQNWEQPKESNAHRRIPAEYADRVRCLVELMEGYQGKSLYLPQEILWQQIPLRNEELKEIKRAAILEDKNASVFIREAIIEKLNAPRSFPKSALDEPDEDGWKEELRDMERQVGKDFLG